MTDIDVEGHMAMGYHVATLERRKEVTMTVDESCVVMKCWGCGTNIMAATHERSGGTLKMPVPLI